MATVDYLAGVDGGGTKTLVRVVHADGRAVGQAAGPGAALRHGSVSAWTAIMATLGQVFAQAGLMTPPYRRIAMGIGIAGHNVAQWADDFLAAAPDFGVLRVVGDGLTTLLGAHGGAPGAVIAVGTGTIGIARAADGSERVVDGWGFPSGDDASGAWMGLRAIHHVQQAIDGRAARGAMVEAVVALCAHELAPTHAVRGERDTVLDWLAQADQAAFARLARPVLQHVDHDPAAHAIVLAAVDEIERMAHALDADASLPLALCGGLAGVLQQHVSSSLRRRIVAPGGDAAEGALLLVRDALSFNGGSTS